MLNKRGHLPTVLLFVGSIVLVLFTAFVMISNDRSFSTSSEKFHTLLHDSLVREATLEIRLHSVVKQALQSADKNNFRESFEQRLGVLASTIPEQTLRGVLVEKKYTLETEGSAYRLALAPIFLNVSSDINELHRQMILSVRFTADGIIQ